ncbi:MAG: RNA polymerase sigma factor [Bacteroidales bacterium]|nr:RNA polymerase sigma factor [Bacteroidales bacterium]MBS3775742.1 RNA polymerase sigma factor [Bacteroidales bacterium]
MEERELYSDSELVQGCRNNDRRYQELLYRKYAKKMYGICMSYAKDRNMAQEILQDGFVKVFKKIDSFKEQGSLEGWIRRIITNTALDHLRQKSKLYEFIDDNRKVEEERLDNSILDKINADGIFNMIGQLPEGAKAVFNLYAVEGYSHKEIAEKLEITEGTSKSQFKRARNLLKTLLRDLY